VLTDNGSELMKHFDQEICRFYKNYWYTYLKSPKMNADVERFNRTFQKIIDYREELYSTPTNSTVG